MDDEEKRARSWIGNCQTSKRGAFKAPSAWKPKKADHVCLWRTSQLDLGPVREAFVRRVKTKRKRFYATQWSGILSANLKNKFQKPPKSLPVNIPWAAQRATSVPHRQRRTPAVKVPVDMYLSGQVAYSTFVSCASSLLLYNKLPQIYWIKNTHTFLISPVLWVRNLGTA